MDSSRVFKYIMDNLAVIWSWLGTHYMYYSEELSVTYREALVSMVIFGVILSFVIPWQNQLDDLEED